jgi:hypothetical protein
MLRLLAYTALKIAPINISLNIVFELIYYVFYHQFASSVHEAINMEGHQFAIVSQIPR